MVPVGILWLVLHLCVISLEPLYRSMMRLFLYHSEPVTLCSLKEQTHPSSPQGWALQNSATPLWSCAPGCRQVMLWQPRAARLKQRAQAGQHHIPWAARGMAADAVPNHSQPPPSLFLSPPANPTFGSGVDPAPEGLLCRMREWAAAESNL